MGRRLDRQTAFPLFAAELQTAPLTRTTMCPRAALHKEMSKEGTEKAPSDTEDSLVSENAPQSISRG